MGKETRKNDGNGNERREPRYVDLTFDAGFKAVFCDRNNKDVLITLLNTFLPPGRQIDDIVEYFDREIEGFTPNTKSVRIDLRCRDTFGRNFIVEMQKNAQDDFFKRCVAYSSASIYSSIRRGGWYSELQPVYLVAFLVEPLTEPELLGEHSPVSWYTFMDVEHKNFAPDAINIIFARLDEAKDRLEDCVTERERCMYCLTHMEQTETCPDEVKGEPLEKLFEASEIAAFDEDKKFKYLQEMTTEYDLMMQTKLKFEQGVAEGERTGYERGRLETAVTTAQAALKEGLDAAMIARMTGLSESQIRELQS